MGYRINTNVQSLMGQRNLSDIKTRQNKSLERLSSGNRIVRAGDDAAGLAISEKLKADIRSTKQATRNANDGVSLIQTAEGGLNEVSNILIRLRELSIQAASDTIGDTERQFSDLEFQSLVDEVERISTSTKFNGRSLLSGTGTDVDFQIGSMNDPQNDRLRYKPQETNATVESLGVNELNVMTKESSQSNLDAIDAAINKVNANRANLGALQNRLQSTVSNLMIKTENLSEANSRIRDTDIAAESAELTKTNILTAAGSSVLAQANVNGQAALRLIQ